MKVTIELDYEIMLVLGARAAKACGESWYDGAVDEPHREPTRAEKETLYQYAFADGMLELARMLEEKKVDKE